MEPILRKKLGARGVVDFENFFQKRGESTAIRIMIRLETNLSAAYRVELQGAGLMVDSSSGNVVSGSILPGNLVKVAQLIFVKKIDIGYPLFQE